MIFNNKDYWCYHHPCILLQTSFHAKSSAIKFSEKTEVLLLSLNNLLSFNPSVTKLSSKIIFTFLKY